MFVACRWSCCWRAARRSTGCATIGEQPPLDAIQNPTTRPGYKPVQMPMPTPQPAIYNRIRCGATARAPSSRISARNQVGDILTVKVKITDRAQFENETQRSRVNKENSGVDDFIGSKAISPSPAKCSLPGRILTADSNASSEGKGSIDRKEELLTNVAAVVTQVLPNGNLVIEGKQEIRVNFEVRELIVAGIVRPEDIESDNTIESTKIARGPHRLWRPRPDHRRAAAALRPAGAGRAAAVLVLTRYRAPRRSIVHNGTASRRGLRKLPRRRPRFRS